MKNNKEKIKRELEIFTIYFLKEKLKYQPILSNNLTSFSFKNLQYSNEYNKLPSYKSLGYLILEKGICGEFQSIYEVLVLVLALNFYF